MNAVAILGGAKCVWEDAAYLMDMFGGMWPGEWIAVNDIGCVWPGELYGWATLHPERLVEGDDEVLVPWIEQRERNRHPAGYTTYAKREPHLVHEIVPHWGGGSSGLFAVAVAHHIGFERVVLCGIPMTEEGAHFEESLIHDDSDWVHADNHWRAWERKLDKGDERSRYLQHNVRSMSGRTRAVLGEPTREWIDETPTDSLP